MKQAFKTIYTDQEFRQLIREELKAVISGEDNQVAGGGDDGYITIDQAAEYLKIPKSNLYKHTMNKTIEFKKVGRRLLFKKSELDKLVKEQ